MTELSILLNELRYGERVCERQSRLYRRLQGFGTWTSAFSSSATVAAIAVNLPVEWQLTLGATTAAFTLAIALMRPGDKAASIEAQLQKYAEVRRASDLRVALNAARSNPPTEVEALRMVCYNDVMREIGQLSSVQPLSLWQRIVGMLS